MRVYLDNCSYNRPYDDQSQMRIHLETQAKLHIQDMVRAGRVELVTSYVLDFENSNNRSMQKKMTIEKFMKDYAALYVSNRNEEEIAANCNYFITTDDRLLKYQSEKVDLVTPEEFIRRMEADD